jgi:hypothetical protein
MGATGIALAGRDTTTPAPDSQATPVVTPTLILPVPGFRDRHSHDDRVAAV